MENTAAYYDVGLLVVRIGLAFLFLSAAIIHSKDIKGRSSAVHFTSLLFHGRPLAGNQGLMRALAFLSVVILYLGGLGVLLGIEVKSAAALIVWVAACGWLIHMRDGQIALETANALELRVPAEAAMIGRIRFSAFVGNASSATKNVPVMAAAILLILQGGGSYSLSRVLGIPALW